MNKNPVSPVRRIVVTGILAAVATVLMYLEIPVPFMPPFIKFDFSELPALVASFAFGPIEGIVICLIKNLIKLPTTISGGAGELCNFLLGVLFVVPAGLVYRVRKGRRSALLGCLLGAVLMALGSLPLNYFLVYPAYTLVMPLEVILSAYETIFSGVDGLLSCLLIFNLPYTFLRGIIDAVVTFLLYKHISPLLKGKRA